MNDESTYRWDKDGPDRRVNLRLRQLIDTITEQLSVQAVQIAQLRADVDALKNLTDERRSAASK